MDFGRAWYDRCHFAFTLEEAANTLQEVVEILNQRKALLAGCQWANMDEYNASNPGAALPRIFVACDEAASLFLFSGHDKKINALVCDIESALSYIAMQGRFAAISLILGTQRPDATIIPAQIRSNCGTKLCGRCDSNLASVIFGPAKGHFADLIPPNAQGRFVMEDGTVFQGCYFKDKDWDF